SVMPYDGGIYVTAAPDILYLKDTDGDGQADVRRVEWTGFHTGSQQLRANALHWGLDNWIYGANGRCNGSIRRPGSDAEISIRSQDFRFDPRHGSFQAITGLSQFGQAHDDWGNRFLSWNTKPVRQVVIPDAFLNDSPMLARQAIVNCEASGDPGRVHSISPLPRQFNGERADHYNALAGLTIFRGDALGDEYAGDAFVGESLANVVIRRKLQPIDPTFQAVRVEHDQDFLASTDPWFHPVNLATGPDGALYVVDFYREHVEHPIYVASKELRNKIDWRRGHQHGRIWRIRRRNHSNPDRSKPDLNKASVGELVETLAHPVGWWRDTAQRLLIQRNDPQATEPLRQCAANHNNALARLHAIWTLHGLGTLDTETLSQWLQDENANIRRHSLRIARSQDSQHIRRLAIKLIADPHPAVRFEAALALAHVTDPSKQAALIEMAANDYQNRWLSLALLHSAGDQTLELVGRMIQDHKQWSKDLNEHQIDFLIRAGQQAGISKPRSKSWLRKQREPGEAACDRNSTIAVVAGMAGTLGSGTLAKWCRQDNSLSDRVAQVVRNALTVAADPTNTHNLRLAAIKLLTLGRPVEVQLTLQRLLLRDADQELQQAAARSLADLNDLAAARQVYKDWPQLPTSLRRLILLAATRTTGSMLALAEAMQQETVQPAEVPAEILAYLRETGSDSVRKQITLLLQNKIESNRSKIIAHYQEAFTLTGNPDQGAIHFKQNCLSCHTIQRVGKQIGPDLSGIGRKSQQELLVDILDPSLRVVPDYLSYKVITHDGRILSGSIAGETSATVTLHHVDGQSTTISNEDIDRIQALPKSLMPEGMEDKLDLQAMADLISFLKQPDRELLK
ncbi:MAG: HEAT repeat domain-containing protein, partial [Planctomycetales bacterium]